ncbi:hypothetical protein Ddye_026353 [Dipteronia dyeriana]|uniref:Reverse transcriptase n=1 Tax=Dipteronia dyeriana TaxID=168575 RepID=A0AAD9TMU6_9ROSI|nr:hypothetical protein Ddye_026353 [Dipteronia dyeriana]
MKGCYFPKSNFLSTKRGNSGSFLWISLIWGRLLLEKGSRWRIGNGRSVFVYKDRWILHLTTFKVFSPHVLGKDTVEADLKTANGDWRADLIRDSFSLEEADVILGFPPCYSDLLDRLLWYFEKSSGFSVRSGYWLARNSLSRPSCSGLSGFESWWNFFWKIHLP